MRGKTRVAAAALVAGGFAVSGALAYADAPKTGGGYGYGHQPGECKPGWGFGDKNHCHSGPPGQKDNPHSQARSHSHAGSGR